VASVDETPDAELAEETGPYDISEAPDDVERLNLGSLHIPIVDGVSVRVQANEEGVIQQVALMHDDKSGCTHLRRRSAAIGHAVRHQRRVVCSGHA